VRTLSRKQSSVRPPFSKGFWRLFTKVLRHFLVAHFKCARPPFLCASLDKKNLISA